MEWIMLVMINENRFEPVIIDCGTKWDYSRKTEKAEMEFESLCLAFQFKTNQVTYVIAMHPRCITVSYGHSFVVIQT
jgi:hypothetical protein